jgi:hypothetical protein
MEEGRVVVVVVGEVYVLERVGMGFVESECRQAETSCRHISIVVGSFWCFGDGILSFQIILVMDDGDGYGFDEGSDASLLLD